MELLDFVSLIAAMLKDEVVGTIEVQGNVISVLYQNGVKRTLIVQ